jgi:hypothetical protein
MYGSANAMYSNTQACLGRVCVLVLPAASSPSISNLISLDPKILFIILDIDPPIVPNMEALFCHRSSMRHSAVTCICKTRWVSEFRGVTRRVGLGWRVDRVCRRRRDANVVSRVKQVNHAIGKSRFIVWRLGNFRRLKGRVGVIDEPEEARGFGVWLGV